MRTTRGRRGSWRRRRRGKPRRRGASPPVLRGDRRSSIRLRFDSGIDGGGDDLDVAMDVIVSSYDDGDDDFFRADGRPRGLAAATAMSRAGGDDDGGRRRRRGLARRRRVETRGGVRQPLRRRASPRARESDGVGRDRRAARPELHRQGGCGVQVRLAVAAAVVGAHHDVDHRGRLRGDVQARFGENPLAAARARPVRRPRRALGRPILAFRVDRVRVRRRVRVRPRAEAASVGARDARQRVRRRVARVLRGRESRPARRGGRPELRARGRRRRAVRARAFRAALAVPPRRSVAPARRRSKARENRRRETAGAASRRLRRRRQKESARRGVGPSHVEERVDRRGRARAIRRGARDVASSAPRARAVGRAGGVARATRREENRRRRRAAEAHRSRARRDRRAHGRHRERVSRRPVRVLIRRRRRRRRRGRRVALDARGERSAAHAE